MTDSYTTTEDSEEYQPKHVAIAPEYENVFFNIMPLKMFDACGRLKDENEMHISFHVKYFVKFVETSRSYFFDSKFILLVLGVFIDRKYYINS